ncbi:hypothetical protein BFJ63_vAg18234 [Fusarium oxysporum f. sp. narcissi]|uniref:G domain-containing protein n=1 Tax=Fusarium oxysporum f. sp. narcissi TaxID=451672 RepID=A0A4Q2UXW3_FUSOX|nr:hypothetical protein BFJ63_vAg18234 [Fusarium oxysporum f. sp. narcissi]
MMPKEVQPLFFSLSLAAELHSMATNEKTEGDIEESHAPAGDTFEEKTESPNPSENPELDVKIILVIGPAGAGKTSLLKLLTGVDLDIEHTLDHGMASIDIDIALCNDLTPYLFIDTPGFGHAASRPGDIKKLIYAILGFYTRTRGGIHGIIYVQDITVDRTMPGMQEATEFLEKLATQPIRQQITFITTKWDIPRSVTKLMRKCEAIEADLKGSAWAKFNVGRPQGSTYFRHGVDCVEDSDEEKQDGRSALLSNVMAHYTDASAKALTMPFSQWTFKQQSFTIATVAGEIVLVGGGIVFGEFLICCGIYLVASGAVPVAVSLGAAGLVFSIQL